MSSWEISGLFEGQCTYLIILIRKNWTECTSILKALFDIDMIFALLPNHCFLCGQVKSWQIDNSLLSPDLLLKHWLFLIYTPNYWLYDTQRGYSHANWLMDIITTTWRLLIRGWGFSFFCFCPFFHRQKSKNINVDSWQTAKKLTGKQPKACKHTTRQVADYTHFGNKTII